MSTGWRVSGLNHGSLALGVGQDGEEKDPVAEVRGTNGGCGKTVPFRIVPAGGKVGKDAPKGCAPVSGKQPWDVFHEDVARS